MKNLQGRLKHLVTAGGIDETGGKVAFLHAFDAGRVLRQGIDADEFDRGRMAIGITADGVVDHTVGMEENEVYVIVAGQYFDGLLQCHRVVPIGVFAGDELNVRILAEGLAEALMAFLGGVVALGALYLHDTAATTQLMPHITADGFADIVVVGTDIGGVFVGEHGIVDKDDRYASIVGTLDGSHHTRILDG